MHLVEMLLLLTYPGLPGSPPGAQLPAPNQRDLPGSDVSPSGALALPPAFALAEMGEGE